MRPNADRLDRLPVSSGNDKTELFDQSNLGRSRGRGDGVCGLPPVTMRVLDADRRGSSGAWARATAT
jgi:hypothetical protein